MATPTLHPTASWTQTIGETAGRVWQILDKDGPLSITTLQRRADVPSRLLYMALGWLAREDKVEVTAEGRNYLVRLR